MPVKQYIAIADGYVDGRVIKEGESFETNFQEIDREKPVQREGRAPLPGAIKRDKNGNPVMKDAKNPPSWARFANEAEYLAAQAADNLVSDPNFEEMDDAALQAYAAVKGVPFDKKTKREDMITAIQAAVDFTR